MLRKINITVLPSMNYLVLYTLSDAPCFVLFYSLELVIDRMPWTLN